MQLLSRSSPHRRHCTKMYYSQKSARLCIQSVRQSMPGCGVWCLQCMALKGLVNKLLLVGKNDSARIGSHHVRDNVLSGGHYPKINPDGANNTPTRSGGVLFRPEGIYFWIIL